MLFRSPGTRTSTVCYIIFDRRAVADIQRKLTKWVKRNAVSRRFQAKKDKETITVWKSDLENILGVFNVRSVA